MFGRGGPSLSLYYARIEDAAAALLNKESAEYLATVDFDAFLDHLVAELAWEPLEWDESQKTIEPFTAKEQVRSQWDDSWVTRDVAKFRLRVPVSHHPQRADFLRFEPPSTRSSGEPDWRFEGDVLVVETAATAEAVARALDDINFWIGGRNREIIASNATLRDRVQAVWQRRRDTVVQQRQASNDVIAQLGIPLHQDPMSRNRPIEIHPREIRVPITKPTANPNTAPALNRDDVLALVEFVDGYARQFEVAPRTYAKLDEEELRDLIISMLNANYPGQATGETFSKLGKTDISFRVEPGQALISECKMWRGAKEYAAAIDQLFGYLTWRHGYAVLIHFCKLKDMTVALKAAVATAQQAASYVDGSFSMSTESRFVTRHRHPQDAGKLVEVFHLFIDLSV